MRYLFACPACGHQFHHTQSMKDAPPASLDCPECGDVAERQWTTFQIHCDMDPDHVPADVAISDGGHAVSRAEAARKEKAYAKGIDTVRKAIKDGPKNQAMKQTHSIPQELYFSKIRQTGDKNYWKDPKNLNKHKSCKVS